MGNVAAQAASVLPGGRPTNENTEVDAEATVQDFGNLEIGDVNLPININVGSNNDNEVVTSEATSIVETTTVTENSNNVVDSNNTENSHNTVENSFNALADDNCPEVEGNKLRWTWFNCGVDKPNKKNVFLSKKYKTNEIKRAIDIAGAKEAFRWWGRSHVWSPECIEYTVNLKHPANYDVVLIFAENYEGNFEDGKRVFDITILADDQVYNELKDMDVHQAVGPKQYLAHTFWDVYAGKLN